MRIETNRLRIRDLEASDERAFAAMAADGSLNDVGLDADCHLWLKDWIRESRELTEKDDPMGEYLAYTIQLKDGTVVGSVGCSYYEDMDKVGITYFTGAAYRNKGYASEAVKAYVKHFFQQYDRPELIATVREANISSWKVIEKAGFALVERKMYKDLNDEQEEMYRFYSMKSEEQA